MATQGKNVALVGRVLIEGALASPERSFDTVWAWVWRIENDRIAECWTLPAGLGLLRQPDAVPDTFPTRPHPHATE